MTRSKPLIIGITGTIGSGKSTVGRILATQNVPVIDSDKVVHDLFDSSEKLKSAIKTAFGQQVINSAGKIDRQQLGAIVFADPARRKELESIVHPATIEEIQKQIQALSNNRFVAVLVPLLFEARLESHYDLIWSVYTDEQTLRTRLRSRDGLTDEEIDKRLAAQFKQVDKSARAAHTIDNSGTTEETEKQLLLLIEKLKKDPE
ncbi:MAG: dephospho-CoA kinase [Candidatus Obscuribacterales bacterium]|nr:dephospho-CoA kinase [Candidatus Obscuribacterales bacterium]